MNFQNLPSEPCNLGHKPQNPPDELRNLSGEVQDFVRCLWSLQYRQRLAPQIWRQPSWEVKIVYIMVILLILALLLVAWALQLMQCAMERKEFSLMLAGTLVATSAAGLMTVYSLMHGYLGYLQSYDQNALPLYGAALQPSDADLETVLMPVAPPVQAH